MMSYDSTNFQGFEIKCLKCGSIKIDVVKEGSFSYSAMTYNPGTLLIKCLGCGNAHTEYT